MVPFACLKELKSDLINQSLKPKEKDIGLQQRQVGKQPQQSTNV